MHPTADPARELVAGLRPDLDDPVARTARWVHELPDKACSTCRCLDAARPPSGSRRCRRSGPSTSTSRGWSRRTPTRSPCSPTWASTTPHAGVWGVWAANPPAAPLVASRDGRGWRLTGTKPWCSGAGTCDHALVTARAADGYRLFAVDLDGPTATPVEGTWPSPALRGQRQPLGPVRGRTRPSRSAGRRPTCSGPASGTARSGWPPSGSVARTAVAAALAAAHARRPLHAHALAHAGCGGRRAGRGREPARRRGTRAADADPTDTAGHRAAHRRPGARRGRTHRGRGHGPRRACSGPGAAGDGPRPRAGRSPASTLYLRQSHAERDLEEHGRGALETGTWPW